MVRGKDKFEWPLLTVNILVYNRKKEVEITLSKITKELDYPKNKLEIIVVDNASTDGTYEMIKEKFPEVKVIRLNKNIGIAGWNYGFKEGRGEYFLVLDDDSHPEKGLKEAIFFLNQNKQVGILACKIIGGMFQTKGLSHLQDWIGFIGCGAIIRKEVVEEVGGFAEWIFLYSHEWEYGLRVLNKGWKIVYFDKCIVNHRTSVIHRSYKRLRIFTTRNELGIIYSYFDGFYKYLLMFRTLFWNLVTFRKEGSMSILYTLRGFLEFIKIKHKLTILPVDSTVQQKYIQHFWSCQPILPTIFKKVKKIIRKNLERRHV